MYWRLERLLTDIRSAAGTSLYRRSIPIRPEKGLVSFTFDDFPASAYRTGGAVLRDHGVRGTFYVAMGLPVGERCADDDLQAVVADGHELACHTFRHLDCSAAGRREIAEDLADNARAVGAVVPGCELHSFSYPFGEMTVAAKRIVDRRFTTSRTTRAGLNVERADLNALRANKVYERLGNATELLGLIERNAERRGWLIFYTHDVSNTPSRFGATPQLLEKLVGAALDASCDVLTMRNAVGSLAFRI
jgi:peptidoglycan/xylan/chitin deacetylase (PgdA/CDA1 family)